MQINLIKSKRIQGLGYRKEKKRSVIIFPCPWYQGNKWFVIRVIKHDITTTLESSQFLHNQFPWAVVEVWGFTMSSSASLIITQNYDTKDPGLTLCAS